MSDPGDECSCSLCMTPADTCNTKVEEKPEPAPVEYEPPTWEEVAGESGYELGSYKAAAVADEYFGYNR